MVYYRADTARILYLVGSYENSEEMQIFARLLRTIKGVGITDHISALFSQKLHGNAAAFRSNPRKKGKSRNHGEDRWPEISFTELHLTMPKN